MSGNLRGKPPFVVALASRVPNQLRSGEHLAQRLAAISDRHGAILVMEELLRIDAERAVNGGVEVRHRDGCGNDLLSQFVRLAYDLAQLQTAAGQRDAERLRVVAAPAPGITLRQIGRAS